MVKCLDFSKQCELVWLNSRPVPSDIGKLYAKYYIHQSEDSSKKRLASLRKVMKTNVSRDSFDFSVETQGILYEM